MKAEIIQEKRLPRSYKCQDAYYRKAMQRAYKKSSLAEIIERFVMSYSKGETIVVKKGTDVIHIF